MKQREKAYCIDLGLIDYTAAYDLQLKIVGAKKKGLLDRDVFLILEHAPVFTLGRRGGKEHLKVPEAFLSSRNIPLVHIERGGDITYHGPGQLVIYPIVNLKTGRWRVTSFVEIIEELMLLIAMDWEIQAERRSLNKGIWVGDQKLGSVGIAVSRSVSYHGMALNINTDLEPFQWIDPCGLAGVPVTSLQRLKQREIPMSSVRERARIHIRTLFNKDLEIISPEDLERLLRSNQRKPPWLKRKIPSGPVYQGVRGILGRGHLHTVCQEALCPNMGECFSHNTATFLIMGDRCTRNCRFCAVRHGNAVPIDSREPEQVAEAAQQIGLKYVVITSVTRDDLADGGASHFAETISAVRLRLPEAKIEVLIPDLQGNWSGLQKIIAAKPDVLNHNLETVPRLYAEVRPQAVYQRSLELLRQVRQMDAALPTKSGLMLGLGEKEKEILQTLLDLLEAGCNILTLGQYLQPSPSHMPIQRFVTPDEFEKLKSKALEMGFASVASGPLVRSSYHAMELFQSI